MHNYYFLHKPSTLLRSSELSVSALNNRSFIAAISFIIKFSEPELSSE